jgi:hypothetical protein
MSTLVIALPEGLPRFARRVTLDGTEYRLRFSWNDRETSMTIAIQTAAEVTIVEGQPMRVDVPLFARFADSRLPAGFLMAQDTSGARRDIEKLEDLGERVKLVYVPAAEVG